MSWWAPRQKKCSARVLPKWAKTSLFLHPKTQEEYALARTERKSGKGYTGFVCDASSSVTLEEDLLRRDLTVNAIAQDNLENLIDPYGGKKDLETAYFATYLKPLVKTLYAYFALLGLPPAMLIWGLLSPLKPWLLCSLWRKAAS